MRVKLEKWYLDFTSKKAIGFFYIMCFTIGRFRIGFSGINYFDSSQSIQTFKFSRINRCSFHKLYLGKAKLASNIKTAKLQINHGKTSVNGTWKFLSPPLKRLKKPLFWNQHGWCDWKVWTPLAEVELEFRNGTESSMLKGTGYIDFVRFTFPFWKIPFHSLYWGRMHCSNSWCVFLSVQTREEKISLYLDPQTAESKVSVHLKRNELGKARSMSWIIDNSNSKFIFDGSVIRILEIQEIMSKGRFLRLLPKGIRRRLSSSGRDEKYEIVSQFRNQEYHGIMEEVMWHDQ